METETRTVDGLKVVTVLPVASPLTDRGGNPVHFTRIVELVLEDDTSIYGCTECEFVAGRIGQVRSHLSAEHPKPKADRPDGDWQSVTLAEAVAATTQVRRLVEENSELRHRARVAERDLAAIRRALGSVAR